MLLIYCCNCWLCLCGWTWWNFQYCGNCGKYLKLLILLDVLRIYSGCAWHKFHQGEGVSQGIMLPIWGRRASDQPNATTVRLSLLIWLFRLPNSSWKTQVPDYQTTIVHICMVLIINTTDTKVCECTKYNAVYQCVWRPPATSTTHDQHSNSLSRTIQLMCLEVNTCV